MFYGFDSFRLGRAPGSALIPLVALAVLALGAGQALARLSQGEGPPQGRRGPPPEALAACESLKAGDACTFKGPRGSASGTCVVPPNGGLACLPKDVPMPGGEKPEGAPDK